MSIYKYEEAIIKRMREITGDDRIIITPSENIGNIIPRISNDEIKLPLIHMIRNNWRLTGKDSHGMKMNGHIANNYPMFHYGSNEGIDGKIHIEHLIPISFSHTFEVWSRTREENDEMIRELIWFFKTIGEFEVEIPYGLNRNHIFTLTLNNEIVDNTNIVSHKDSGELFLQAIITNCDDAYLWKSSAHNPTCIHINTELKTNNASIIRTPDYNILTSEHHRLEDF